MLSFIVPVKSKRVTSNWDAFSKLYERTLKSICNQTNPDFKVVVVCHEIPQINFSHENIHFLQVDFEPPIPKVSESQKSLNKRREIDKGNKLKIGAKYAKSNFGADYIMTVDSDDLISKYTAHFVNNHKENLPGWYIKNGYIHLEGKKFFFKTYKFNYLCGSSVIIKPDLIKHFFNVDPILYFDHRLKTIGNNITLSVLPFSGGIYSMANGENHLMSIDSIKKFNNHKGWFSIAGIKRIYKKFKNYSFRFITPKIKEEFGFYEL